MPFSGRTLLLQPKPTLIHFDEWDAKMLMQWKAKDAKIGFILGDLLPL